VQGYEKITQGDVTGSTQTEALFGRSVTPLGDFDGDSVIDIAVGASQDDDGGETRGAVYILFLNTDGTVKSHQKISDTQGNFGGSIENNDQMGYSVTSLGDLDQDGIVDIAVGSRLDGPNNEGSVWIVFLAADGTVKSQSNIGHSTFEERELGPLKDAGLFGCDVANVGDLDGDAVTDLAVGAREDGNGAVWVLFLTTDGSVQNHQKITSNEGGFTVTLGSGYFGASTAFLGDVNAQSAVNMAVGDYGDDDGGTNYGAVYILWLKQDGTVDTYQKLSATEGGLTDRTSEIQFGFSVSSIGDLDGDAITDIAVGSYKDSDGGVGRGAVWVLYLNADGTVREQGKISDTAGGFGGGLGDRDYFGVSVSSIGDLDGDSTLDLAVGATRDDDGGEDGGALYILFLTAQPTTSPTKAPTGTPTPVPSESPTPVPSESPTAVPSESPTAAPTAAPTATPTASPTPVPTPVPSGNPTPVPSESPTATPQPTASPTRFRAPPQGRFSTPLPSTSTSTSKSSAFTSTFSLAVINLAVCVINNCISENRNQVMFNMTVFDGVPLPSSSY
jgi:hypothetical protein